METLFELSCQDQTLNPQIGTFTGASQTTGTFTLEDGEYYLTNGDTKGFYTYKPVAMQSGLVDDSKVIIEFDLKVVAASANTHAIIGTYAGVDGNGVPTGAKITLQYNNGDIELVLGSGTTATLIESADVVVDQWYHFRIDCYLAAPLASTYQVKIDGVSVTTVTGATTDYELGIISVLGTDLHACDECGIKNITFVTETNMYVGRTALEQALQDVKGYVDTHCMDLTSTQTAAGDKTFAGTTTTYDVIPAATDTYDLGSSTKEYNNAYIKALTVNGTAAGDILTHNASEFASVNSLAAVATSGNYNDLSNKPTIPTVNNATLTIQKNGTNVQTFTANQSTNATANIIVPTKTSDLTNNSNFVPSTDLATVATSGNYNDLSNKPTIPTVNNATLTIQKNGTTVKTFTANASSNVTCNIPVPTKTSDLTNDSGFLTSADLLPIGSYIQFAGSQAPAGFLVCNGGAISRTTYSALFAVIGTTYGSGNGSTTFNLPNLTDRFLQGSSTSGTVKNEGLPNITGYNTYRYPALINADGAFRGTNGSVTTGLALGPNEATAWISFDASWSNSIYGSSSTVQPPALTCLICIKY